MILVAGARGTIEDLIQRHYWQDVLVIHIFFFLYQPIRLSLFVEFVSYSVVFFSHNKLINNIFNYDFSVK